MTWRVAHLTFKGGHAAQDWSTDELATAEVDRLKARDDVVCVIKVDPDGLMRLRWDSDRGEHWARGFEPLF